MFKKPLSQLKTSAPIRASERRKLKQHIISSYSANPEDGNLLVPDGILTAKFLTYAKEPGNLYIDPDNGNPLWFTVGKGSEDLIPTVYTLWKLSNSNLLPSVLTPSAVIPILAGGADLMIPGVITHSPSELAQGQLVAIHQLSSTRNADETVDRVVSPPLAVGRMAISSEGLKVKSGADEKGKAVLVLHVWKDHLWEMGQKGDVPPGAPLGAGNQSAQESEDVDEAPTVKTETKEGEVEGEGQPEQDEHAGLDDAPPPKIAYSPQEITELLTKSLIHAIANQLSTLPHASFPIPATQLYTTYILPYRPAYPTSVLLPSAATSSDDGLDIDPSEIHIDPSEITIKSSSNKSLTTFLKALEKSSLLTLKPSKQKSGGGDFVITSVNAEHPDVVAYASATKYFVTVAEIEAKRLKGDAREGQAGKERERAEREVEVRQLWKPHLKSLGVFEDMGASTSELYSLNDIRSLLNDYFSSKELINKNDQAYINLNPPLLTCATSKSSGEIGKKTVKGGKTAADSQVIDEKAPQLEFMKRDELMKKISEQMQGWYEVRAEGRDTVRSKGEIKPIQVEIKMSQGGRRGLTAITGFEPFLVVEADEMAEKFRKICAGSTSVSPYQIPGTSQQRLKVTVQGKQSKPVVDYLMERGIPKKWIEVREGVGKLKK